MNVKDNEIQRVSELADKILEVVMNTELDSAESGLAALLHVATTLAVVMQMSDSEFVHCALECFQAGKAASQDHEVH
jgi:hypothetical protein